MPLHQRLSRVANSLVLLIPLAILAGWFAHSQSLKLLFYMNGTPMNPMSAVCFLALGGSLYFARENASSRAHYALASWPLFVSLFRWVEVPFLHVRLDQILFTQDLAGHTMPLHTAIGFFIASSAVLLFRYKGVRALTASPLLALGVGWLSLLAITGYFYGVDLLNQTTAYSPMAFGSAITFLFFSVSVLLAKPDYEPTRTLVSPTDAGRIARLLIPLAICFPVLSGWLRMTGETLNVFSPKLGVTFFALINIAVWASAIWTTAHYLYRAEQKNKYLIEFLDKNAKTDLLSGVWNRRFFEERLETESAAVRRHGRALSCIICDIDFFKKVNDTFGHPVGDLVIKNVAQTLMATARKEDIVCRFGGEEFVILLPDTTATEAAILAERMRQAIEKTETSNGDICLRVTCSFGVAQATGSDKSHDVLDRADVNLYAAKQAGRNKVMSSRAETSAAA